MRFKITVKYYNKENKIDTFTTFTDKAIRGRELEDFVKQFFKDSKIIAVIYHFYSTHFFSPKAIFHSFQQ